MKLPGGKLLVLQEKNFNLKWQSYPRPLALYIGIQTIHIVQIQVQKQLNPMLVVILYHPTQSH